MAKGRGNLKLFLGYNFYVKRKPTDIFISKSRQKLKSCWFEMKGGLQN